MNGECEGRPKAQGMNISEAVDKSKNRKI